MKRRTVQIALLAVAAALGAAGCTVNKTEQPPPSGPSELSTSLTLRATPDTLPPEAQMMASAMSDV